MQEGVTPLVIGNAHHLDIGQFLSYQNHADPITMLTIDPEFDLDDLGSQDPSKNHIQTILTHKPNFLNHYCHLGYHSYMVEPMALKVYEKLFFESFRLGDIRKKIEEAEPVVRGANFLSFDLDSVRASDYPLNSKANPFGFTGEEACQLAWYAGLSDYISSFGLYGYDPPAAGPEAERSAFIVAGMIWYFVEGYYQKVDTLDFESDNYIKYTVQIDKTEGDVAFFKSKKSGKWWIQLHKKTILPCSYSDYEEAAKGELPDRWLQAITRLGVKE
jgi:arginase family enzyme